MYQLHFLYTLKNVDREIKISRQYFILDFYHLRKRKKSSHFNFSLLLTGMCTNEKKMATIIYEKFNRIDCCKTSGFFKK
jgi:hypothetical protein